MKIIDAHVHLVQYICGFGSRGELRAIGEGKARYADGSVISLIPPELGEYDVTPEKVIALMDQEQVEKAVILQGNYLGFQNEYALMAEKKYPNRFRAAITYDPFCRNKKLILENLVEKQGARIVKFEVSTGSGLMAAHETVALDGDYMEEAYQYAEAHGMVCVMDIGRAGTASYQPEALRRAILRHPEMKFVVCHVLMPQKGGEVHGPPAGANPPFYSSFIFVSVKTYFSSETLFFSFHILLLFHRITAIPPAARSAASTCDTRIPVLPIIRESVLSPSIQNRPIPYPTA